MRSQLVSNYYHFRSRADVSVKGLSFSYPNNKSYIALENLSFELPRGSITALIGPNGGGKSTLFKCMTGTLSPTQGNITLAGLPVRKALKSAVVSYVPQDQEIDWDFPISVNDIVAMGRLSFMRARKNLLRIPNKADQDVIRQALHRVGMEQFASRQIGELSGGQRRRAFIARALAQNTRILLLDEPFSGVDKDTEADVQALFETLTRNGTTIVLSTHHLDAVAEFCSHTVLLNRQLFAAGRTQDVYSQEAIDHTFRQVGTRELENHRYHES